VLFLILIRINMCRGYKRERQIFSWYGQCHFIQSATSAE